MSESALRSEIKTILSGIAAIGVVHDYERWAAEDAAFLNLFKDPASGKIFGWEITRAGARIERVTQKYKVTHRFVLKGYYGIKDSAGSEKLFNAVVETIAMKILSTKITGSQGEVLPQVDKLEPRVFSGILCHCAEIRLDVAEIVEKVSTEVLTDLLKVGLDYYLKPGDDASDASDIVTL